MKITIIPDNSHNLDIKYVIRFTMMKPHKIKDTWGDFIIEGTHFGLFSVTKMTYKMNHKSYERPGKK